tara:strand:+ start:394 stop:525 length:132 start_codon:yes stop_codon:yes gene_type:complete
MFSLYFKKILKETEYKMLLRMAKELVAQEYLNQITKQKLNKKI